MQRTWRVLFTAILFGLGVLAAAGAALVLPVQAAPGAQTAFPTPTVFPAVDESYTLEQVGGVQATLTFSYEPQDGITPGDATATSQYPDGMVFTLAPSSDNGAIQDVILFLRFAHGSGTRVVADYDADAGEWVAHPWDNGAGQPAWTHFTFYWRVRDEAGTAIDTAAYEADYADPTREWYRMESPYYTVYWYGMAMDDPDLFARKAAHSIASTHQRRVDGFGRALSYMPVGVVYGSFDEMNEMYGGGTANPTAGGFTSDVLGMSVQYVPALDTVEKQTDWLAHVLSHELTHLYQYDVIGATMGPNWWVEGQADWFAYSPGLYDARLFELATLQDLPTLSKPVTRNTAQADGQLYLVYDMGASFINWLNANYGGIETHSAVIALMKQNVSLYDALEQVTGVPFFDLENEWRAYIGLPAFELADLDPAAALEPIVDPLFEVGETVTLPSTPPLPAVYEAPSPTAATSGQCFANTPVEVLAMGTIGGEDYYQVNCMGQIGWMPRGQLIGPGQ